jgi:hypothetical protein
MEEGGSCMRTEMYSTVRVYYAKVKIFHHQGGKKNKQEKYKGRRIRVGREIRDLNMTKREREKI